MNSVISSWPARLLRSLASRRGGMDLPSIMIGAAVVAILSVGVTATIFGAIPWAQNHSAKQNISAVRTAQSMASTSQGAFLTTSELKKAGYLDTTAGIGIVTNGKTGPKSCFVAVMQSKSGKMFYGTDKSAAPAELKNGTKDSCVLGAQLQAAIDEAGGKVQAARDTYTVTRAGGDDVRVSAAPTSSSATHAPVAGLAGKTITEMAAGTEHTCVIADNTPWCWGQQSSYRLGNKSGTAGIIPEPVKVSTAQLPAGKKLHHLTSHWATTCLIADEKPYCWGNNNAGGIDASTPLPGNTGEPKPVPGMTGKKVTDISAGYTNTCAVSEGAVYCWGKNSWGLNGNGVNDGATATYQTPRKVEGALAGKTVTSVTAGRYNVCAVADGSLYCWGASSAGQLPTAGKTSAVPVKIAGLPKGTVGDVTVSNTHHICAVVDTNLWCMGRNTSGELGNGTLVSPTKPIRVKGALQGKEVESVTSGIGFTCAVASGEGYCWGAGTYGQTGTGTAADTTRPVKVPTPAGQRTVLLEAGEFSSVMATVTR